MHRTHTRTHMHMHIHTHVHIKMYIYTHIYTLMHIHTHTHTQRVYVKNISFICTFTFSLWEKSPDLFERVSFSLKRVTNPAQCFGVPAAIRDNRAYIERRTAAGTPVRGCSTLQHTATQYSLHREGMQQSAAHCNTLQHTATRCNTLRHNSVCQQLFVKIQPFGLTARCSAVLQCVAVCCSHEPSAALRYAGSCSPK